MTMVDDHKQDDDNDDEKKKPKDKKMITTMTMMMITIVMMMIMKRQKIRKVIFVVRAMKMMIMMEDVYLLTMMLASRSSGLNCSRAVRTAMRKPVEASVALTVEGSPEENFRRSSSSWSFSIRMTRIKLRAWKLLTPVTKRARHKKSPSETYDSTLFAARATRTSTPSRQPDLL